MEEVNKLPLKRVELSLTKFNEVAIPHHLDLLRQHKANITKYEEGGQYARVRAEQTHARRVVAQLRALLAELEALRRRVRDDDLSRFDALTQRSRDLTLRAIVDYLESAPLSMKAGAGAAAAASLTSTDSVGVLSAADADADAEGPLLQLQVEDHEAALAEREAAVRGWGELQREVAALHAAWRRVHAMAAAQRDTAERAAQRVESAGSQVREARAALAGGERLRAGAWGAGGAALGALAAGPVGLVVGAKAGAAALLAGSLCGYLGAALLGRRRARHPDAPPAPPAPPD